MNSLHLVSVFIVGLLGSVHCVGMCGGIVSAFSLASRPGRPERPFPVAVVAGVGTTSRMVTGDTVARALAYNLGRIGSYAAAGALAGGLAQSVRTFSVASSIQIMGYWLANLMLVALGLYLMNAWHGLTRVEAAGRLLWLRLQPLTRHLLPVDSPAKALMLGALWGWLPCGMVYSVLMTAMLTASATAGAGVMLAFGLGTLPVLLAMGLLGAQLQTWLHKRPVRVVSGVLVLSFGLLGLWRAAHGFSLGWLDTICLTPTAQGLLPGVLE